MKPNPPSRAKLFVARAIWYSGMAAVVLFFCTVVALFIYGLCTDPTGFFTAIGIMICVVASVGLVICAAAWADDVLHPAQQDDGGEG